MQDPQHLAQHSQDWLMIIHQIGLVLNTLLLTWLVRARHRADRKTTRHWGETGFCGECGAELAEEQRRTKAKR
jgi:hypothetical protein